MILESAAAIAAISMTITKSNLFRPIQRWKLTKCPYCLSHWLAFAVALKCYDNLFDFVVESFCLVAISSLISIGILHFLKELDRA